ncbi:helix-turn-helix domain-containing protein [Heyndrickxia coagulans]|uniref:helix-turn-helix domain-containing protein n=1 Tax=Heyndrickxia coagulans TaxID=1398 RepID=UPI0007799980|nr:helix-turn-helix domain-containing protein [Heyndrickxia coagulans]
MNDLILESIKLKPAEDTIQSERARHYLKIIRAQETLDREKEKISALLNEEEKKEVFKALSKQFGIPYYVNVNEAAEIMGISPQMVRRHCADGNLKASQTLHGSGKWRIEANQLMNQPNWEEYLKKRARIKLQSTNLANKMLDYLGDEDVE